MRCRVRVYRRIVGVELFDSGVDESKVWSGEVEGVAEGAVGVVWWGGWGEQVAEFGREGEDVDVRFGGGLCIC